MQVRYRNIIIIIHRFVIPNLYDFLTSMQHKRRYFEQCFTIEVNGVRCCLVTNFLHLCCEESEDGDK